MDELPTQKCEQCRKEFQAPTYSRAKYCSVECSNISRAHKIKRNCLLCDKEFFTCASRLTRGDGKFCSRECKCIFEREPLVQLVCGFCGETFFLKPSYIRIGQGKYCSRKCARQANSGENHWNFKDWASRQPYCEKWTPEFRERIRAFFDYRCVACDKTQEENGRALHCHHVEYNKQTCCDESIPMFAALCNHHHFQSNFDRDRWQYMLSYIVQEVYGGKSFNPK